MSDAKIILADDQQRVIRFQEASKTARAWVELLKKERQASGLFSVMSPMTNNATLTIGCIDDELRALGYSIVSLSAMRVGQDPNGNGVQMISMFVRALDGEAKRILS